MKTKSRAQDFADSLKKNPKEIIEWAKREIVEYQKLIKILEKKTGKNTKKKFSDKDWELLNDVKNEPSVKEWREENE